MTQPDSIQPDDLTPREMGTEMARLREQFGLSAQEVSQRLHIRPRYIAAMEEGRYDLMPAKAYARGYMHSYAEFLGMDADEVVAKCFVQQAITVPVPSMPTKRVAALPSASLSKSPWRGYAIMVVGILIILLLVTQLTGLQGATSFAPPTVAPVPDTMLSSVRALVMPTAGNHDCLTVSNNQLLSCFYADVSTRALGQLNFLALGGYTMNIDISDLILDVPEPAPEEAPKEEPDV